MAVAIASAEVYDSGTNTWSPVGSLATARFLHSAELLADGRVLVVAGATDVNQQSLASAEMFDPQSGQFSPAGMLQDPGFFKFVPPSFRSDSVMGGKTANVAWVTSTQLSIRRPVPGRWPNHSHTREQGRQPRFCQRVTSSSLAATPAAFRARIPAYQRDLRRIERQLDQRPLVESWARGPDADAPAPTGPAVLIAGGVDETTGLSSCELGTAN